MVPKSSAILQLHSEGMRKYEIVRENQKITTLDAVNELDLSREQIVKKATNHNVMLTRI